VPATAALLGDANWWPSKTPRQVLEEARRSRAASAVPDPEGKLDEDPEDADMTCPYEVAVHKAGLVATMWRAESGDH
jgi:RND superfamily putative drug exporter